MHEPQWRDRQGDVWELGDDGLLHSFETAPFSREHVEKKWGPLIPIPATRAPDLSAGVPPRVWEKARPKIHDSCLLSGAACSECEAVIMDAFEAVYGAAETMDEVISMIAHDLAREHARELAP
ncbi:hypothetical protein SEA_MAGRITTE_3 [Microbacterium phage Magritte]|nr:hypothetical protein SEA_MAGRITTE_3 [Microbacterium phage Magritte]